MAEFTSVLIAIVIGVLAAIVYTLRIVVQMNEKLDRLLERSGARKP